MEKHRRSKNKHFNKQQNIIKITNNCTVILKSQSSGHQLKIRISVNNGFSNYQYLIGRPIGSKVKIKYELFVIDKIIKDKNKKQYRRNYSLLSVV